MAQVIDEKIEELNQQIAKGEEMLRKLRFQKSLLEGEKRIIHTALWPMERGTTSDE
jgi:hypothetical protein